MIRLRRDPNARRAETAMQLAPTRYVKLEDNKIIVEAGTAAEMRSAIKELRHKKREFQHHRRGLQRQQKAAEARAREKGLGRSRSRSARGTKGWFATMVEKVWPSAPARALSQIEADLQFTDDVIHTIDAHIVELEGRLLRAG
jgi:hypothetical protein